MSEEIIETVAEEALEESAPEKAATDAEEALPERTVIF